MLDGTTRRTWLMLAMCTMVKRRWDALLGWYVEVQVPGWNWSLLSGTGARSCETHSYRVDTHIPPESRDEV